MNYIDRSIQISFSRPEDPVVAGLQDTRPDYAEGYYIGTAGGTPGTFCLCLKQVELTSVNNDLPEAFSGDTATILGLFRTDEPYVIVDFEPHTMARMVLKCLASSGHPNEGTARIFPNNVVIQKEGSMDIKDRFM